MIYCEGTLIKEFFNKIGLLKNQILIFVILGCIVFLTYINKNFDKGSLESFILFLLILLIFFGTLVFYCWASIKLPGTAQELMFEANATRAIEQHHKASENTTLEDNGDDDEND